MTDTSADQFPKVEGGGSLILAWQIRNKDVLVVGGGEVAAGRILNLLNADAKVTVISPSETLNPEVRHRITNSQVTHIARKFLPEDLTSKPWSMVLTAIDDPVVSTEIWKLCKEHRIPANIADVPPECDFYFGSIHRDGPLQIMVSTNGKGPRLANQIRRYIAETLPKNAGAAIEKVGKLRAMLREREPGKGKEVIDKRMGWMIGVSDAYSLEEFCDMGEGDMKTLLGFYERGVVPRLGCLKALQDTALSAESSLFSPREEGFFDKPVFIYPHPKMFSLRNILARNIIKMGKPIKLTPPGGIVKTKPKNTNTNRSRTFASAAPRMNTQAAAMAAPELTEAVPENTMRFADLGKENLLNPVLLQTITDDLKFDHMMPVQSATLHDLLTNRADILAQAKTGTGKTMAFLLPAIQTILNKNRNPGSCISLLVISPTRELAMQIAKEAESLLSRFPQYKTTIAIGGTNKSSEERKILNCDILIATPGRLNDHLQSPQIRNALRNLDTLVLDEADRLLDMGFAKALEEIVQSLPDKKTTNRQGMLFSATIAPHVQKCAHLVLSDGYKFVSTIPKGETNTHERVPQHLIIVPEFKDVAPAMIGSILSEIKANPGGIKDFKAILFAPTSKHVDWYAEIIRSIQGIPSVEAVHSRHTQGKRTKTTDWFRATKSGILVATDVVARGMDFPGVTNVFQVGTPLDKETYIHRLGRTARAGREGRGVFIITQAESWFSSRALREIPFIPVKADVSSAPQVMQAARAYTEKGKVYQAWIGYYKTHAKAMQWDVRQLVYEANKYSSEALCCTEVPGIEKSTVGKMGLKGVPGITVLPNATRGNGYGGGGGRGARA